MSNVASVPGVIDPSESSAVTVLIAVNDDDHMSRHVAETARALFGDRADYFVIDVGEVALSQMSWGYVYPVSPTAIYEPRLLRGPSSAVQSEEDRAERRASSVASATSLPNVTALSDIGDPATAILAAAAEHKVDVIVVGSHDSGWFHRLFSTSVGRDVLAHSILPVLVVKE